MPLVSYVDSDEDDEAAIPNTVLENDLKISDQAQKPPPPSLPTSFHSLYASNARSSTSDDPTLHGGRQRQIPHVVGNWPSFIYLEWLPSDIDLASLDAVIRDAASQLQGLSGLAESTLRSLLRSDLGVRLPLHISLSTPLMLATATKDKFTHSISTGIQNSGISVFRVVPSGLRLVHNFDKSRCFLILTLGKSKNDALQKLLTICNKVAEDFDLPQLYAGQPSMAVGVPGPSVEDKYKDLLVTAQEYDRFHISIAWTLDQPGLDDITALDHQPRGLENMNLEFRHVRLKVGNHISTIPLEGSNNRLPGS